MRYLRFSVAILCLLMQVLGVVYFSFGVNAQATMKDYERAIESAKARAEYQKVVKLYDELLSKINQQLGVISVPYARKLHELGEFYLQMRDYDKAEYAYRKSYQIFEKKLGVHHPDVATIQTYLAGILEDQGRYSESYQLRKAIVRIYEKAHGPNSFFTGVAYNDLSRVYYNKGQIKKAEWYVHAALRSLSQSSGTAASSNIDATTVKDAIFVTLQDAAGLYVALNKLDKAEQTARRLLKVTINGADKKQWRVGGPLLIMSQVYYKRGDYAGSLSYINRALDVYHKHWGHGMSSMHGHLLSNKAEVLIKLRRYREALWLLERVSDYSWSKDKEAVYRRGGAFSSYKGNKWVESAIVDLSYKLQEEFGVDRRAMIAKGFKAVQRATITKAALALNQLAARTRQADGATADLVRKHHDLLKDKRRVDAQLTAGTSSLQSGRYSSGMRSEIEALRRKFDQLELQIKAVVGRLQTLDPDYLNLSEPQPLNIQDVHRFLGSKEAIIVYHLGEENSYVWVIRNNIHTWKKIHLTRAGVEKIVALLRSGLQTTQVKRGEEAGERQSPLYTSSHGNGGRFDLAEAHKLYKKLIQPIESPLIGIEHIFVVPSGALSALPLHVLVARKPLKRFVSGNEYRTVDWLINKYAITILPSLSSLRTLRGKKRVGRSAQKTMLGIGDPVFQKVTSSDTQVTKRKKLTRYYRGKLANVTELRTLKPLPHTKFEILRVAKYLGVDSKKMLFGLRANETNIKSMDLKNYKLLYFATHGFVAGELKGLAEPAIALSVPDRATRKDDGLLTASEIANLKLNAEWVILSACNTAAADNPGSEALSGLTSAFFYAGARSLLVSHWPVYSDAALSLTTKMFKTLREAPNTGRAEALRRAMISLLNDKSEKDSGHPSVWAPFVVVGEGGAFKPQG